jgi:hypothetical protein
VVSGTHLLYSNTVCVFKDLFYVFSNCYIQRVVFRIRKSIFGIRKSTVHVVFGIRRPTGHDTHVVSGSTSKRTSKRKIHLSYSNRIFVFKDLFYVFNNFRIQTSYIGQVDSSVRSPQIDSSIRNPETDICRIRTGFAYSTIYFTYSTFSLFKRHT